MTIDEILRQVAAESGVDWALLMEMAWRESRWDPKAMGRAGDMGLMQILPSTWQEWAPKVGAADPWDALSNARVAATYLQWIRGMLAAEGRPETYWALVAYNWGIGNVLRLLRSGGGWAQVPIVRQDYALDIALAAEVRTMYGAAGATVPAAG